MNYYQHHIGDYLTATVHLSWLEDAAYRRLLDVYYSREQCIPADIGQACRLVRAASPEERQAVETVLREFFEETATGWKHRRCEEEIERARAVAEKARANGKKGGRKPSANPEKSEGKATENPEETQLVISGLAKPNPEETQKEPSRLVLGNPEKSEGKAPITHYPIPINSVPIGTGAAAPLSQAEVWKAAVDLLAAQGMGESQARAFIGKLTKELGSNTTALGDLVEAAVAEQPADARAWMLAAAKQRAGVRSAARPSQEVRYAGAASAIFEGASHV
ncbi:MAG: YdaU family protein [Brachymonas sp.]|nr:YdaU family protein [Brachymonas sp.]